MPGSLLESMAAGFDSLPLILGEMLPRAGQATPQFQGPQLQDPSTLNLAFTCLGTLAIFFAAKRVMTLVWRPRQVVVPTGRLSKQSEVGVTSPEPSRGAA